MLQQLLTAPVLDHQTLDLDGATQVTYLLEQSFRYDYTGPVHGLRHQLIVVPPYRHGDQHLRDHRLVVEGAPAEQTIRRDSFGNTVVELSADRVEDRVCFAFAAVVERLGDDGPPRLPASAWSDQRWRQPTRLTAADESLRELAHALRAAGDTPRERALRICQAVHAVMVYEYGITSVATTAAEAFRGGRGVCQDSAHIMLALCHLLDVPARYVSGHLLGQGGTHAWVEVLVTERDENDGLQGCVAVPFDPCSGRQANARYLTVATGRDYADVPPTSGSYFGDAQGLLSAERRLAVLEAR